MNSKFRADLIDRLLRLDCRQRAPDMLTVCFGQLKVRGLAPL